LREIDVGLNLTWIGHSTVLFETGRLRLLTDPVLRSRVAHLRRVTPASRAVAGDVDAALISHVHLDHLDVPSLRQVGAKTVVVPRGAGRLLARRGLGAVVELEEGEEVSFGAVTVLATHAEHPSRRSPLTPKTPAFGYVFSGPARIYFAGDTNLFTGMRELAFGGLDVALLPIAGWGPRVGPGHLDPRRAAEALRLLRPRLVIPIHWGTYRRIGLNRSPEALLEPLTQFEQLTAELAPEVKVCALLPGERLDLALLETAADAGARTVR
jgi:L-ascorbate metabolism protein UlaG (beta-lactamase superfamily)